MAGTYYAKTRELDPVSGDVRLVSGAWAEGSPAAELVVQCLRTPKGSYLPDPEYGLDTSVINHASPNATSKLRAAIEAALKFLVDDGTITDLLVRVTRPARDRLFYDVQFRDPRAAGEAAKKRQSVTGTI